MENLTPPKGTVLRDLPPVFHSKDNVSIFVEQDDEYGGAHIYHFKRCLAWDAERQHTIYEEGEPLDRISFVRKALDGTVTAGLQTEQLLLMLIDRHINLGNKFPHPKNEEFLYHIQKAYEAQLSRVEERMSRGVMGELKK